MNDKSEYINNLHLNSSSLQVENAKTEATHALHISELKDKIRDMKIELAELQQRSACQTDLIKELKGRLKDKEYIIKLFEETVKP